MKNEIDQIEIKSRKETGDDQNQTKEGSAWGRINMVGSEDGEEMK